MRKRRKTRFNPIPLLTLLLIIGVGVGVFLGKGEQFFDQPFNSETIEKKVVEIPKGATTGKIATLLYNDKLIKSELGFKSVSKSKKADGKMKAGRYEVSASMRPSEMIQLFVQGKTVFEGIKVTIPEGYNNRQIIDVLVQAGLGTKDGFEDALKNTPYDYAFLKGVDRKYDLEGFLFPDTYYINPGMSEAKIIDMMLKRFAEIFTPKYMARVEELGYDMNTFMSLAAIVEREAKVDAERPKIAGVFYNRLKIDMLLQSCASVQYILNEPKAVLTFKDIKIESPYNTYIHKGLPPSPIASPGEKSIVATLYPEKHDYLYFVVTNLGDGSHYFGKTGAEHEANIKKSNANK